MNRTRNVVFIALLVFALLRFVLNIKNLSGQSKTKNYKNSIINIFNKSGY